MNEPAKTELVRKLGGWERLIVFSGVILTIPMFALLGTAIYALAADRPDAYLGVLLSAISLLVLWAIIWGMLWIVSGVRLEGFNHTSGNGNNNNVEQLKRENERLKQQLAELKRDK